MLNARGDTGKRKIIWGKPLWVTRGRRRRFVWLALRSAMISAAWCLFLPFQVVNATRCFALPFLAMPVVDSASGYLVREASRRSIGVEAVYELRVVKWCHREFASWRQPGIRVRDARVFDNVLCTSPRFATTGTFSSWVLRGCEAIIDQEP